MATTAKEDQIIAVFSAQLEEQCHIVNFTSDETPLPTIAPIDNLETLSQRLPEMCATIFKTLGSQQCEAAYQSCLNRKKQV